MVQCYTKLLSAAYGYSFLSLAIISIPSDNPCMYHITLYTLLHYIYIYVYIYINIIHIYHIYIYIYIYIYVSYIYIYIQLFQINHKSYFTPIKVIVNKRYKLLALHKCQYIYIYKYHTYISYIYIYIYILYLYIYRFFK